MICPTVSYVRSW